MGANSNPLAAGFVQEMVKTIRGLGGIAVTSTQGMQDLFGLDGGKYGKGILDSSRIKLVMQMEEQEARLIQGVLNLSEDEVRQITRFRRGEGLLCIGYNHVPVQFHTTEKEYNAIKGRLIPDDDQHTLALTLLSTKSELDVCHVTLLDMVDVADFFAYRSGDYAVPDFYGGSWGC